MSQSCPVTSCRIRRISAEIESRSVLSSWRVMPSSSCCLELISFTSAGVGPHWAAGLRQGSQSPSEALRIAAASCQFCCPGHRTSSATEPRIPGLPDQLLRASRRHPEVERIGAAQGNPHVLARRWTSKLLTGILSCVAEFERELLRERTAAGIRAAQAAGKHVGRPKRIFRRDEVVRLRDDEGLSWRAIAAELNIPVMTAVMAYKTFNTENGTCTETAAPKKAPAPLKGRPRKRA